LLKKGIKRAKPLFTNILPLPLLRERVHPEGFSLKGIKGMGFIK